MENQRHNTSDDIVTLLVQPKMLIALLVLWVCVVVVGSTVAILATNSTLLSDAEVEAILSENKRLALAANVAYADTSATQTASAAAAAPVYPDRLVINGLSIDLPVSNPQTRNIDELDAELKSAVVRYPDSAGLGQSGGNVLIFGHSSHLPIVRNKFYKAFNDIETLNVGDAVQAVSGGDTYQYRVTRVYRASAEDDQIPLQVAGSRLTLLTCDTFGKKSDRWVVEAEFVGKI